VFPVKTLAFLIVSSALAALLGAGAACKLQFPRLGPVPDYGRPVHRDGTQGDAAQKSAAALLCKPASCPECKPVSCAERAVVPIAYVPETRPAKTITASPAVKTAPAASPGGPRLSALIARDELEKLSIQRVLFNAPDQMNAGVHEKVEVRLEDNLSEDFTAKLKELGIVGAEEIGAGSSIKARLTGEGFEIKPLGDDERSVGGQGLIPWMWDVTPVRSGTQPLLLLLTINVKIPSGGDERKDLPIFTKPVSVVTSPAYSAVRFVRARWPWFAGALLTTALIVWLLRRRRAYSR
jgi:hypothetical protein